MKKIWSVFTFAAAGLVLAVFFCSCATYPTAGPSVCLNPDAQGSWICSVATEYSLTPEKLDMMLLDATTIGLVAGALDKKKAREVILGLIQTVETVSLSYSGLIRIVLDESEKAALVAQLVSRHLMLFDSPVIISEYDRGLILAHLRHQLALLN